jgi:hypothetical protein
MPTPRSDLFIGEGRYWCFFATIDALLYPSGTMCSKSANIEFHSAILDHTITIIARFAYRLTLISQSFWVMRQQKLVGYSFEFLSVHASN